MTHPYLPIFAGFTALPRMDGGVSVLPWIAWIVHRTRLEYILAHRCRPRTWHCTLAILALLVVAAVGAALVGTAGALASWLVPPPSARPLAWAAYGAFGTSLVCLGHIGWWALQTRRAKLLRALLDPHVLEAQSREALAAYARLHPPPQDTGVYGGCAWAFHQEGLSLVGCVWRSDHTPTTAMAHTHPSHGRMIHRAALLPSWARPFARWLWGQDQPLLLCSQAQDLHSAHARLALAAAQAHTAGQDDAGAPAQTATHVDVPTQDLASRQT